MIVGSAPASAKTAATSGPYLANLREALGGVPSAGLLIEQFVDRAMLPFRAADRDRDGLDIDDIERAGAPRSVGHYPSGVREFLPFDLDDDGTVSREEVVAGLQRQAETGALPQSAVTAEIGRRMSADRNGDDRIVFGEMPQLGRDRHFAADPGPMKRLRAILALDLTQWRWPAHRRAILGHAGRRLCAPRRASRRVS